jgi:hypothetical protein
MGNSKKKSIYFGGKLWCSFFGHQFITSKEITNHFKEYTCSHCQLQLTNDEKGQKVFLTPELKAINETLELFYQKRHHLV